MANIAIFGGSFNPAHTGHYQIVSSLVRTSRFEKIMVVPARQNPLKKQAPVLSDNFRLSILKATFDDFSIVDISDYELRQHDISYTYKTIDHFSDIFPNHDIYLILGEDSYYTLPYWTNLDKIARKARFIVFKRPEIRLNQDIETLNLKFADQIEWRAEPILNISATVIRSTDFETTARNEWLRPKALEIWAEYLKKGTEPTYGQ